MMSPERQEKQSKRFSVQPDTWLVSYGMRREAAQFAVRTMSKEFPAFIGGTLFGSLSKGSSKKLSDIDLCIYLNAEDLAKENSVSESLFLREPTSKDMELHQREGSAPHFSDYFGSVTRHMENLINSKLPWHDQFTEKDIHIMPMSSFVITDGIQAILGMEGASQTRERALFRLSNMFNGLALTQNIIPYRTMLLSELKARGDDGERVWRSIIEMVIQHEHYREWETLKLPSVERFLETLKLSYPLTLDKALRIYGRDLKDKNVKKKTDGGSSDE